MSAQPVSSGDRRPIGVLVVGAVQFVRAAILVIQLLQVNLLPAEHRFEVSFQIPHPAPGTLEFYLVQGIGIGLVIASIAVGLGLLTGNRWGWIGAIVISGVSLAISIGAWWANDPTYAAMLINVVAVFYLNQRDVRAFFGELAAADRRDDG